MITLFRRIREKLIASGSITKYLLYAIGEILLVVIGILIALQVNNWNEERKEREREKAYLEAIREDMIANIEEIEEDIADNENVISKSEELIRLSVSGNYAAMEQDSLLAVIYTLGNYSLIQLEEGTIEEIMSSGSLQVFENEELRSIIADWERNLIAIREMERFAREGQQHFIQRLQEFVPAYKIGLDPNILTPEISNELFNDIRFMNTIDNIRFVARVLNEQYSEKINQIEQLILLIDQELRRF